MTSPGADATAGSAVVIISAEEGMGLFPPAAFLAHSARQEGFAPRWMPVDFGTEESWFQSELAAARPALVLVAYRPEWRDLLGRVCQLAREAQPAPVALVGPSLALDPEPLTPPEGVLSLPFDPGGALARLAAGECPTAAEVTPARAWWPGLGPTGRPVCTDPVMGSLFCEFGDLPLLASRRDAATPEIATLLERLAAPAEAGRSVPLGRDNALAPLEAEKDAVRRITWWDRDAGEDVLEAMAGVPSELPQALRLAHGPDWPARFERARAAGARRVIATFDHDVPGVTAGPGPLIGENWELGDLRELRRACTEAGLELGILMLVGIGGETPEMARARREAVEELAPDRLRCFAFEASPEHRGARALAAGGHLPPRGWNRELHTPLLSAGHTEEEFLAMWADALVLAARIGERALP